jgi:hypothetical protein
MFCPRCATKNESGQSHCRQCGLALAGAWLALDGRAGESLEKLNRAQELIKGGSTVLLIFTLIPLAIAAVGLLINQPALMMIAFVNQLLGSIIGIRKEVKDIGSSS